MHLIKRPMLTLLLMTVGVSGAVGYLGYKYGEDLVSKPGGSIIIGVAVAIFFLLWAWCAIEALAKLQWTNDAVSVKLLGITLQKHARNALGMICTGYYVRYRFGGAYKAMVGICFLSLEEAAARREKQIAASSVTRGDLVWRKKKANWQEKMAQEYLWKRMNRVPAYSIQREIIWIEQTPENLKILQNAFQNVPWMDVPRNVNC